MQRHRFDDMNCSVAQALDIVGEWWTLLIVRDALLGVTRFDDFHDRLGISRNVLTARLDRLVAAGVFERAPYQDRPVRHDYRLTAKGRALWPVVTALREWGDRWVLGEDHAPLVLVHDRCGKRCSTRLHCAHCGEELRGGEIHVEAGPGADAGTLTDPPHRPAR